MSDSGALASDPSGDAPGPRQFPCLETRSLLGGSVAVPDELPGPWSVLIVAFQRWQQGLVDEWVAALAESLDGRADVTVYELPVLPARYKIVRRFIDGGMASSIGVPDILGRTLTHYGNVDAVTAGLGLPDTDTIAVVLVAEDGTIRAMARGPVETETMARLLGALGTDRP